MPRWSEFGAKGFDGASTRAIARRIGAHQPQINYHFASKEALWTAAVDHLFAELAHTMRGLAVRVRGVRPLTCRRSPRSSPR